ncbi:hypothetical protein RvY_18267 [Ramazzottius varieornatus]|uniref:HAT C-terminal dimerisation domain-containing protein n=1 Tax=Ramazzottius varieornatus TaxID=947166 RepID=A0A1D1W548_RAMVA|nr:hypothetical protein RvY_18267 [Ramazzottius varieornatus]
MVKFFELLVTEMEVEKRSFSRATQFAPEVNKIRACVIYVRRPTIRERFLATIKPATEDLKLPLDVSTRWNSLLHIVESAYARRHELHDNLSAQKGAIKDEVPLAEEWIDMEDLIELSKPLEAVSALWICELAKNMLVKLDECLKLSWKKPGVRIQVPMIARLLDPSIKDANLPSVEIRTAAGTMLEHIVQLYKGVPSHRGSSDILLKSTAPPPNTQLSIRERMIAQITSAADSQLNDVDQFFLDPKESVKRDVLEFWNMSESRYPTLYRIAKDVLAA